MRVGWLRKAIPNQDEEASFIAAEDPSVARLSVQRTLDAGSLPLPRAQAVHLEGNAPTFSDALTTARVDSLTGHLTSGVMSAGSLDSWGEQRSGQ